MSFLWSGTATVVSRLKVRGSGPDRSLTVLRAGAVLGAASLRPATLPAEAILCIRRFRDPLPRSLSLGRSALVPPAKWERAVRDSLEELTRRAVRPARSDLSAGAEAVLFADQAELLACLAEDWCRGCVREHWWWQALFHTTDVSAMVFRAWCDSPEHVPAAMQLLAKKRAAVTFARRLTPAAIDALLGRILRTFALSELRSVLANRGSADDERNKATDARRDIDAPPSTASPPKQSSIRNPVGALLPSEHPAYLPRLQQAPWSAWVPEAETSELSSEKKVLLAVALMLRRGAAVVRTQRFAKALQQWHRLVSASRSETPAIPLDIATARQGRSEDFVLDAQPTQHAAAAQTPARTTNSPDVPAADARPDVETADSIPEERALSSDQSLPRAAEQLSAVPPVPPFVQTDFGGVFYLINVGLFLELYGDFTSPLRPGIGLPIWDFVAIVGEHLLGTRIRSDPIWPLLARLAGREEDQAPGTGFEPPESWHLPAPWLAAFPEAVICIWSARRGRVRVDHPRGFCLVDLHCADADPLAVLTPCLEKYAADAALSLQRGERAESPCESPLARWLGWLVPYLRVRLCRALQCTTAELPDLLCTQGARVFVTPTRVDVLMQLSELPIAIRLAGLDRDPGWVPAAGRFVAFRFE